MHKKILRRKAGSTCCAPGCRRCSTQSPGSSSRTLRAPSLFFKNNSSSELFTGYRLTTSTPAPHSISAISRLRAASTSRRGPVFVPRSDRRPPVPLPSAPRPPAARPPRSPPGRGSPASQASGPVRTSRPRSIITTRSQIGSTSGRMCELRNTRLPRRLQRRKQIQHFLAPCRIQPRRRLVQHQQLRIAHQRLRRTPAAAPCPASTCRFWRSFRARGNRTSPSRSPIRLSAPASGMVLRQRHMEPQRVPTGQVLVKREILGQQNRSAPSPGYRPAACPSTRTSPDPANKNPIRMLMLVVFPAPFGPRNAHTSPRATSNDTSVSASIRSSLKRRWYTLVTVWNSMAAVVTRRSFRQAGWGVPTPSCCARTRSSPGFRIRYRRFTLTLPSLSTTNSAGMLATPLIARHPLVRVEQHRKRQLQLPGGASPPSPCIHRYRSPEFRSPPPALRARV